MSLSSEDVECFFPDLNGATRSVWSEYRHPAELLCPAAEELGGLCPQQRWAGLAFGRNSGRVDTAADTSIPAGTGELLAGFGQRLSYRHLGNVCNPEVKLCPSWSL